MLKFEPQSALCVVVIFLCGAFSLANADEFQHTPAPTLAGQSLSSYDEPESATSWSSKPGWTYSTEAVAAANPIAAQAGLSILRKGGNALDAAICIQMVLTLVEPQSSGIGGGGFIVLSRQPSSGVGSGGGPGGGQVGTGGVTVFDGRETAPASANETLFLNSDGTPLKFKAAQKSSRSIGVPGIVAMLWQAHQRYGKLPWRDLIQPAVKLAENGFAISPRLFQLLSGDSELIQNKFAREYFYQPDLTPWPIGHNLKNPELASILKDIAREGDKAFYQGIWASAIIDTVNHNDTGQRELRMGLEDLKSYRPLTRVPLCFDVKTHPTGQTERYRVCGAPPPASGTLAMAQIFGMLEKTIAKDLPFGPDWLHFYTEASRLALADRAKYVSDTGPSDKHTQGFEDSLAWQALISANYLRERAKLIGEEKMKAPQFGVPLELLQSKVPLQIGLMPEQPEHGTSHISIVDRLGNSVAFTSSIESAFGSHRMVNSGRGLKGGFLLNSQLTDFSFLPFDEMGRPIANRPGPGKRPRSSMSPTLVFKIQNETPTNSKFGHKEPNLFFASLGSPGGNAIIHFTAQTLWAMLNWGLTPQEAINQAHFALIQPSGDLILEQNLFNEIWLTNLTQRHQAYIQAPLTSGVQAIQKGPLGLTGGADPRREGVVLGW